MKRGGALDAARMAERAYARLSRILHHQFQAASRSSCTPRNPISSRPTSSMPRAKGLGGVTEFFKHRAVLPFTGSYAEFEHVLQHEMVHQFQYDVYSRGRPGAGVQTLVAVIPRSGSWKEWPSTCHADRSTRKRRCGCATRRSRASPLDRGDDERSLHLSLPVRTRAVGVYRREVGR